MANKYLLPYFYSWSSSFYTEVTSLIGNVSYLKTLMILLLIGFIWFNVIVLLISLIIIFFVHSCCIWQRQLLLINLFVNVIVFGDFDVYHKVLLIYSYGTDRPDKPCNILNLYILPLIFFPTQMPSWCW